METERARFYYGYVVVAAAFVIMTVAWGAIAPSGFFSNPWWRNSVGRGPLFRGLYSGDDHSWSLHLLTGRLTDRIRPVALLISCSLFLGIGYALSSQVEALWHLYLFYGVFTGIGMSGAWAPIMSVVTRWFVKNRSLMSGIIAAGGAIGIAVLPLLFSTWHPNVWLACFFSSVGCADLCHHFLRGSFSKKRSGGNRGISYGVGGNSDSGRIIQDEGISLGEAFRTRTFWLLALISFCDFMLINVIAVHIVPHAIQLNISPIQAATVLSLAAGVSIPGRIFMGGLADRIGNRPGFYVCSTMSVAAFLFLQFSQTLGMLYFFSILYGLGLWATGAIMSPYLADLFGLKSHGSIFSATVFSGTLGGGLGPILVGYTFDVTGNYRLGILLCLFASIAAWIALCLVKPIRAK